MDAGSRFAFCLGLMAKRFNEIEERQERTSVYVVMKEFIHGVSIVLWIKVGFHGLIELVSFMAGLTEPQVMIFVGACSGVLILSMAMFLFLIAMDIF